MRIVRLVLSSVTLLSLTACGNALTAPETAPQDLSLLDGGHGFGTSTLSEPAAPSYDVVIVPDTLPPLEGGHGFGTGS